MEYINPVVVGMARAAGSRVDHPGPPQFDQVVTLPILIHGDAAILAQGIVAETLNLSRLSGYQVGGTVHIIDSQIGFTTNTDDGRSTLYASDLAKGFYPSSTLTPTIQKRAWKPRGWRSPTGASSTRTS